MTIRALLISVLLTMQLTACTLITDKADIHEVDVLVANQHYGRALEILTRIDPKDPDYATIAERRRHIEALASRYEQSIRSQANREITEGNWRAALDRYDDALARLPKSMVLRDGLAQLHQQQTEELERLDKERLLAQGTWLKQTLPTYQRISQVNPRSRHASLQRERMQQQASDIADQLAQLGNRALANNDLENANQTLKLAGELSDAPAITESIDKLRQQQELKQRHEQQQRTQREQQQREAQKARQQQVAQQHLRYQRSKNEESFIEARGYLSGIQVLDPNNAHWQQERAQLEGIIEARVERLYQQGVNAYSRSQYEEAATAWRAVLQLEPEHKLAQDNLLRAERVLQRIEELKQQR